MIIEILICVFGGLIYIPYVVFALFAFIALICEDKDGEK